MLADSQAWTVGDLETLPDDSGWLRYEIIDEELLVTRAPHIRHQDAASRLNIFLGIWSQATQLGSVFQTPGVVFSPTDAVISDVVWISRERLAKGLDDAGHLTVAPELIVEILSPGDRSEQRDQDLKLQLYSQFGVQEYWIVSWERQTIAIYRQTDEILKWVTTLSKEDIITSQLLPGFSTPVAQIFSANFSQH